MIDGTDNLTAFTQTPPQDTPQPPVLGSPRKVNTYKQTREEVKGMVVSVKEVKKCPGDTPQLPHKHSPKSITIIQDTPESTRQE